MALDESDVRRIYREEMRGELKDAVRAALRERENDIETEIRGEVKEAVRAAFREREDDEEKTMLKTVAAILKGFGIDEKEEAEVKDDFRYLRRWRKSSERITGAGLTALVMLIVGGLVSAIWVGFQTTLKKFGG